MAVLLKRPEVRERTTLSDSALYRLINKGEFPPPIQLGPRAVAWLEEEVTAWIESKIEASREKEAA
ncbi:AlpA family transcriptional regulator [Halomonas sp. TRM85114]|uniref:helix-turn-helix transcriptional regulator n=1 Tax=Halomonas jincaotanensis TaxID=2810616 RepID=UPI001BD3488A|nr:AlpA family transcriptional regulator [Halomonas jincaotanensis]MBS9404790.1 AlpA family transcriptional regulator [Halomonas jincaotanensis]